MSKSMMNGMKVLQKESGFTLVELLVALTILAIGLMGVLGMQVFAIRGNAFASNMSIAQNIAAQKIEFYKNISYGSIKGSLTEPVIAVPFGTPYNSQGAVPASVLPGLYPRDEDKFKPSPDGTLTDLDRVGVDVEDYGGLRRDNNGTLFEDSVNNATNQPPNDGVLDKPFDRFRRVTLVRIINGAAAPPIYDSTIMIKVIVFWKGPEGVEHKVVMMSTKSKGG